MKVTYNWLKDFVEIKIPARELADKLTMAGLEVISLEEKGGDCIFEIEITSNRADWLSVLGIAREVAAITGKRLASKPVSGLTGLNPLTRSPAHPLTIKIENKKDCPLYTARIIKNVKVGPSPEWMRKRLELVGCRSVNNVVDITNYLLFELGEPLHAFDLDKIVSESAGEPVNQFNINIRRAERGEEIITIDGEKKILDERALVIASATTGKPVNRHTGKPIALAGVMGGKNTEVTAGTKNILLEAAVFNPLVVRRSRQAVGLQSESSYRFERGVDLAMVEKASLRAMELMRDCCAAEEVCFTRRGLSKPKAIKIDLDTAYTSKLLGITIAPAKIKHILSRLGFKVSIKAKHAFKVSVPSFREDAKLQVDLIEEVARIFGFTRVPLSLPSLKPELYIDERRGLVTEIKKILVGLGLSEAITYSLTDKQGLDNLSLSLLATKPVEIINPLNSEEEVLRPTLLLGLVRSVAFNFRQKQDYVSLFEIARVFRNAEAPQEELRLAIALSGTKAFLLEQGLVRDEAGLLNLKGILETVFGRLGIKDYAFNPQDGQTVKISIQNQEVGAMFCLGRQALESLEIKNRQVFLLEVSVDKLLGFVRSDKKFAPLPKYPGILRDISFILKDNISVGQVLILLKEKGAPLLREIKIADYYQGKQIPAGFRGLTLACLYASLERTLTEKEVQPVHDLLCATLTRDFAAKLR